MSFKDRAFLSDKATKTNYVAKYIRVSSNSKEKNERKQTVHSIMKKFLLFILIKIFKSFYFKYVTL